MKKNMLIVLLLATSFSMYPQEADKTEKESTPKDHKENKKEEPGYHEHDGFYFRYLTNMFLGYSYVHSMQDVHYVDKSDAAWTFSLQFGYSLNQNIIFYISFDSIEIPPPINPFDLLPRSINPSAQRGATGSDSAGITKYSFGTNYYFMPQNIYINIAVNLASIGFSRDHKHFSSADNGLGLQASVGKEWWVSKNWGLGLALNLSYDYFWATRSGYPTITPMHAFAIGLSFSATYN